MIQNYALVGFMSDAG